MAFVLPYESPRYTAIALATQAEVAEIDDDDDDPLERLKEIVARHIAAREAQRAEDAIDVTPPLESHTEAETVAPPPDPDDDCDGELA